MPQEHGFDINHPGKWDPFAEESAKEKPTSEPSSNDGLAFRLPPPVDSYKIPTGLKSYPFWVCWKSIEVSGKKKPLKVPYDPKTGEAANVTKESTWGNFEQAFSVFNKGGYSGIGVVFNDTGLAGIDLDDCRNPKTGELKEWAEDIILFIGSYTEVSPSGTGVKIFVTTDHKGIGFNNQKAGVEMYTTKRFFTVTGDAYE